MNELMNKSNILDMQTTSYVVLVLPYKKENLHENVTCRIIYVGVTMQVYSYTRPFPPYVGVRLIL